MSSRWLQLFRVFLPSWKFFDDFDETPELQIRTRAPGQGFGDWFECAERSPRTIAVLFFNPRGNLFLATQALFEQFLAEPENLVSQELLNNRVHWHLLNVRHLPAGTEFQFRIVSRPGNEDLVISNIRSFT